jgi:hypothetical protein
MNTISNSQTGPKTPEGKRRSSLNALKHGLTAQSPQALEVLAGQYEDAYTSVSDKMRAYYRPADPLEDELVKRISDCLTRLERARAMERHILSRRPVESRPTSSYERILRYERSIDLQLHRAISAMARKRETERIEKLQNETAHAQNI